MLDTLPTASRSRVAGLLAGARPARTSGWAFEFNNEHYPDIDDTAMVLLALQHAKASDPAAQERCERRALHWLTQMQSSDGGWAAFDVDNNWALLNRVPFADHNAMLDPTCPDITGRVLEALCRRGLRLTDAPVDRGVSYLLQTQEEDGSWWGRWGVNHVYGTAAALPALEAAGIPARHEAVRRAVAWLREHQNADGGFGEDCRSYNTGEEGLSWRGRGQSTASQTAWALIALVAAGEATSECAGRAARWLCEAQRPDGDWDEQHFTGTGFPRDFMIRYHLYRIVWPLIALGRYREAMRDAARRG